MADGKAKVFYLTYERYESLKNSQDPDEHIDANSFYVVSETSQLGSNMLSLYLGEAKQCDLLDITQDVNDPENPIDYVDFINNDNIPESYKIPDKLLFYKQGTYGVDEHYSMLMYYVPEGEDREQGRFIQVGDSSSIKPDNLTILLNQATNEIYGVGADLSGKTVTWGGVDYTASQGATIYNNYNYNSSDGNKTNGMYANVFGARNAAFSSGTWGASYATVFGDSNTMNGSTVSCNTVFGDHNTCYGTTSRNNFISASNSTCSGSSLLRSNVLFGEECTLSGSSISENIVVGYQNSVSGSTIWGNAVFGISHTISVGEFTANTVTGGENSFSGSQMNYNSIFGYKNTCSGTIKESMIIGHQNSLIGGTLAENVLIHGGGNTLTTPTSSNVSILGHSNSVTGNNTSISDSLIVGTLQTIGISGSGTTGGNFIGGFSNNVALTNTLGSLIYGYNLTYNSNFGNGQVLLGYNNDSSVTDSVFTYAYGRDFIRLSNLGLLQVCGTNGDVVTATGNNLNTEIRTVTISTTSHTFLALPFNGKETILQNTVSPYTISSIEISDIAYMSYNNGRGDTSMATSDDYNSVIVFKKGSSMTTADSVLANFTDPDLPKIYLLNPDIDISSFTIIHVMLFNDGINICAIVAGYEEVAPL